MELGVLNPTGNRDKGHPRKRGTHHAKCNQIPRCIAIGCKKNSVIIIFTSKIGDAQKNHKIANNKGKDKSRCYHNLAKGIKEISIDNFVNLPNGFFSSKLLEHAVDEMAQLPGIGKRTALRMIVYFY